MDALHCASERQHNQATLHVGCDTVSQNLQRSEHRVLNVDRVVSNLVASALEDVPTRESIVTTRSGNSFTGIMADPAVVGVGLSELGQYALQTALAPFGSVARCQVRHGASCSNLRCLTRAGRVHRVSREDHEGPRRCHARQSIPTRQLRARRQSLGLLQGVGLCARDSE